MDQKHPSHYFPLYYPWNITCKTSNIQLMIFLVNCIHPDENSKYSKELGVVSGTSAFQKGITPLKTHKKWLNNVKQINATLW